MARWSGLFRPCLGLVLLTTFLAGCILPPQVVTQTVTSTVTVTGSPTGGDGPAAQFDFSQNKTAGTLTVTLAVNASWKSLSFGLSDGCGRANLNYQGGSQFLMANGQHGPVSAMTVGDRIGIGIDPSQSCTLEIFVDNSPAYLQSSWHFGAPATSISSPTSTSASATPTYASSAPPSSSTSSAPPAPSGPPPQAWDCSYQAQHGDSYAPIMRNVRIVGATSIAAGTNVEVAFDVFDCNSIVADWVIAGEVGTSNDRGQQSQCAVTPPCHAGNYTLDYLVPIPASAPRGTYWVNTVYTNDAANNFSYLRSGDAGYMAPQFQVT